uniref:Uncharacterized protein n=1 Tax=uncultured Desulfobacterium sp. TaxID=201089 RepID=E1YIH6_9BACT|nr:unknown protein [uncultured Desulfobacterium sp.]
MYSIIFIFVELVIFVITISFYDQYILAISRGFYFLGIDVKK